MALGTRVGVGDYGVQCIEFRNCDDGAANGGEDVPRGVGVLYGEQRRRSVIMGNGRELWARGWRAQGVRERGWAGWLGVGGRCGLGLDGEAWREEAEDGVKTAVVCE